MSGDPDRAQPREPPGQTQDAALTPPRRKRRPPAQTGPWTDRQGPGEQPDTATQTRSQRREQAAREALAPLGPGERPRALLAAVLVCALLGGANVIAYAAGATIAGRHPGAGVLTFSVVMAALAGGMWTRRYLAVLAFEALLAVTVALFSLFLVEASNVEGLLLCLAVIGAGGWLFWKLVRVMGRLAAPRQSSS